LALRAEEQKKGVGASRRRKNNFAATFQPQIYWYLEPLESAAALAKAGHAE
jgi:hypothetical protein